MPPSLTELLDGTAPDAGALSRLLVRPDGRSCGAAGEVRIAAPPARVWGLLRALDRYPGHIPMIERVRREEGPDGERVTVQLRFRIALFSVRFAFVARSLVEEGRSLELRWLSGEPGGVFIRVEVEPLDEGRATRLRTVVKFDIDSLGWLVNYFLKHHPEIQLGIYPGAALVLIDAMRAAAEGVGPGARATGG